MGIQGNIAMSFNYPQIEMITTVYFIACDFSIRSRFITNQNLCFVSSQLLIKLWFCHQSGGLRISVAWFLLAQSTWWSGQLLCSRFRWWRWVRRTHRTTTVFTSQAETNASALPTRKVRMFLKSYVTNETRLKSNNLTVQDPNTKINLFFFLPSCFINACCLFISIFWRID